MKRASVLLAAALLSGCGEEIRQGTIAKVPTVVGPLGPSMGADVAIAPPRDARPESEHRGEEDHVHFFFTVLLVTHWERAGNYVTDDFAATKNASAEFASAMRDALVTARAANVVGPADHPPFTLETTIEHLYGTRYDVGEGTVVVIPSGQRRGPPIAGGGAGVKGRQYASYGNVVVHARLVDHRTGQPVVVWDEHVTGAGQAMPTKVEAESAQTALREAVSDACGQIALRVATALDRLGHGPNGAGYVLTGMPPVFLLERVSRYRDFLETVFVETRSGRVLRHDVVPLADHAYGKPGEWLLSRRTPEGIVLSGDGYEAFARALAEKYDLRQWDDAYRYHFFGVKGAAPPPRLPPE